MGKNKIIQFDNNKYNGKISMDNKFKSDELLDKAMESSSIAQAKKYAKQALEVYPDNIDAQNMLADFEDNLVRRLKKYDTVVKNSKKLLEEKDMFNKENIGSFWVIIETRPYMRARHNRLLTLMSLGRYTEAVKECEELLELCTSDNMGIRYILIGLYCILERFDECEKLFNKYEDWSLHMVFTMAIMYFKKGDYKKAKEFLKHSEEQNEFIISFLFDAHGELFEEYNDGVDYYSHGSEEEAFLVINGLIYLLASVPAFLGFVAEEYIK